MTPRYAVASDPGAPVSASPDLLDRYLALRDHLSHDLLGGPRWLNASTVINLQKGGSLPFVLALMWAYDCWTPAAWVYLALHGSYGVIWLIKDQVMPDPAWERPVTVAGAIAMWAAVLGPYWLAPWLLIASGGEAAAWRLGLGGLMYAVGVVLMVGADAQKFFTLRVRRGLITDGFFKRVRHPNYLGEMLLYAAFAVVAHHPLPWLVLAWVWSSVFVPNMLRKERSMSRYPGWAAYTARAGFLWPKLGRPASEGGVPDAA